VRSDFEGDFPHRPQDAGLYFGDLALDQAFGRFPLGDFETWVESSSAGGGAVELRVLEDCGHDVADQFLAGQERDVVDVVHLFLVGFHVV
jgi:hypothetical protein